MGVDQDGARADTLDVTVVIPAFNREDLIERALVSVHAQRPRPPARALVVDDGSTDGTATRAAAMGATVVRHDRNLGVAAARNTGIREAATTWVALLDSDDEWLPGHLDALWSNRDDHLLVADSALFISETKRRWEGSLARRTLLESPAQLLFPANIVATSACMFRRAPALDLGGYLESLCYAEDLDFLVRLLEQGSGLVLSSLGTVYHGHDAQASLDSENMRSGHREIITRYADRPWWSPGLLRSWDARCTLDDAFAARHRGAWGEVFGNLARLGADPRRARAAVELLRWRRQIGRQALKSRAL